MTTLKFSTLTLGIGNLINDEPLDPFNLHGNLNTARQLRDDAQTALSSVSTQLANLNITRGMLDMQLSFQYHILSSLPQLQSTAGSTEFHCTMLQRQFGMLADLSSKPLLKNRPIKDGAVVTEKAAFSTKEFASGLLEMCSNDTLIDVGQIDEVQLIKGEIIRQYGDDVPDEIAEAGNAGEGEVGVAQDHFKDSGKVVKRRVSHRDSSIVSTAYFFF